jgi:IS30 family transposase
MISARPAEVADRAMPDHWEEDLILGLGSSAIGTLVEGTTRFTILLHLPRNGRLRPFRSDQNGPALAGHGADAVRNAITCTIITLPEQVRQSLTWDQGAEMAQHAYLRIGTGLQVYFCDRTAHGSAALMRIPMACYANTSQRGPNLAHIAPITSRRWR